MSETHWNTSADVYCAESEKIGFYQVTNRQLIAAGQLKEGMTVVDLACGTGLTTRAILATIGDECSIYAVDLALNMLRQAKRAVTNPAVRFIHASGRDFSRHIPQRVSHVFCNAAFWHFPDLNAVMQEIRAVLSLGGYFLFNLPDQQFDFADGKHSNMAQVVADCLKQPTDIYAPPFSDQTIGCLAAANGFCIKDRRIIDIPVQREDLIRFYSIPHIGARRFPHSPLPKRRQILQNAFGALAPDFSLNYRWAQFILSPHDAYTTRC